MTREEYLEIRRLHAEGLSRRAIARRLGIHRRKVRQALESEQLPKRQGRRRGSIIDPHRGFLLAKLQLYPELSAARLYAILREQGFTGSYTLVKQAVAEIRPRLTPVYQVLDFEPGAAAQVDWGVWQSLPVQGGVRRLSFFTMVLCHSRMLYAEFFFGEALEYWLTAQRNAFEYFGGVPEQVIVDNCKTAVIQPGRHGREAVFNEAYEAFAGHYGFRIVACTPGRPNEKGRVEKAVGYLKTSFLAVRRFVDHNPYYRQAAADLRHGLDFGRKQYDRWMLQIAHGRAMEVYDLLHDDVYSRGYIGFDATGMKLQVKGQGKLHSGQMWVARAGPHTGPEHVVFKFTLTKEPHEVIDLLHGFQGYVQTDAAPTHDQAMKEAGIIEVGCWAHATRKFKDAVSYHPEAAGKILDWLRDLYDVERDFKQAPVDQRFAMRQQKSVPILKDLYDYFLKIYKTAKALPKSKLGQAIAYCLSQKEQLHRFLEDGRLLIDNNRTEHALRPFGIGRKNWLFAGSIRGARAAAVYLSLFMSCRALGINPWVYMKDLLDRIQTEPDLHALLPGNWTPLPENTELGVPVYINTDQPGIIEV